GLRCEVLGRREAVLFLEQYLEILLLRDLAGGIGHLMNLPLSRARSQDTRPQDQGFQTPLTRPRTRLRRPPRSAARSSDRCRRRPRAGRPPAAAPGDARA